MAEKENTIGFLRELAAKRQNDLEKSEAVARNYLERIDAKNSQIAELNREIRRLNAEILRMASSYAAETKVMVDRVISLSEAHAADFRAMHFGEKED
jgi:peptidoglycan hydrolase CwlO-like protein